MNDGKYTSWSKSRYTSGNGNCIEVATAPTWRKSTYSNSSANCVEVAPADRSVGVRDSKHYGRGPILEFTAAEWRDFVRGVKTGGFDL